MVYFLLELALFSILPGGGRAGDDQLGGYTVGYVRLQCKKKKKKETGILDGCVSCLGFMVVAQSWDQSGFHVAWIITSTTGMDLMPKSWTAEIRRIRKV